MTGKFTVTGTLNLFLGVKSAQLAPASRNIHMSTTDINLDPASIS